MISMAWREDTTQSHCLTGESVDLQNCLLGTSEILADVSIFLVVVSECTDFMNDFLPYVVYAACGVVYLNRKAT